MVYGRVKITTITTNGKSIKKEQINTIETENDGICQLKLVKHS